MEKEFIYKHVDHTMLKQFATWDDIKKVAEESLKYHTASICIPPCYIKRVHEAYPEVNICTVIGFPNGYNTTEVKLLETKQALEDGANEIDMVINLTDVKNKDYDKVTKEIKTLKDACGNKVLKVIIETCFLTDVEKIEMCKSVTDAGADYIKTSTGFGTGGATREDIKLFKEHIGPNVKMKAAGGIKCRQDLEDFIELGCERLGSSSAVKYLSE